MSEVNYIQVAGWAIALGVAAWFIWKERKKILAKINGKPNNSNDKGTVQKGGEKEEEDAADTIKYRGEEYEIDWEQERFLRVWKDKEGNWKSQPVRLPNHIWQEVFGSDEEEEYDRGVF